MKVPATEISRHICIFSFLYILNIFSLKSSENKDTKPGPEKAFLYMKKSVLVKSEAYKTFNPEASNFPLSV